MKLASLRRRNRSWCLRRAGMTLVEIVIAGGVLLTVMAGFAAMASVSTDMSRDAQPYFLAQDTAVRVAERMQSESYAVAFQDWWTSTTKANLGGINWAVGGTAPFDAEQLVLFNAARVGRIAPPLTHPSFLRVRFLNEVQYAQVWNLPNSLDLDFDGESIDPIEDPTDLYSHVAVVIEVHWRDSRDGAERTYQLKTVLRRNPELDGSR